MAYINVTRNTFVIIMKAAIIYFTVLCYLNKLVTKLIHIYKLEQGINILTEFASSYSAEFWSPIYLFSDRQVL